MSALYESYEMLNNKTCMPKAKLIEKFYVYRFISKDEIIYVGQTMNIKKRMHQHFNGKQGHLKKECYQITNRVEYIELSNKTEMNIAEVYFINKYKPKYNSADKYEDTGIALDIFDNKKWKIYKFKEDINIKHNNEKIVNKQIELERYKKEKVLKKQVVLLNTGQIFKDISEAANYIGVTIGTMRKYTKGEGIGKGKEFEGMRTLWIKYENLFNLTDEDYKFITKMKNIDNSFKLLKLIDLNYANIESVLMKYYMCEINIIECKKEMNLVEFLNSKDAYKYKQSEQVLWGESEEDILNYIFERYHKKFREDHRISSKFINYKDYIGNFYS